MRRLLSEQRTSLVYRYLRNSIGRIRYTHTFLIRFSLVVNIDLCLKHFSAVVDLVAKMANFVGNINNVIDAPNTTCPDDIHEDVVSILQWNRMILSFTYM